MKNNLIKIIIMVFLSLNLSLQALTGEFDFKITEIEILDNGNIYKGLKGGKATTKDNLEIIADNFLYNKLQNKLIATGNVKMTDIESQYVIFAKKITYLKNIEKIFTEGSTQVEIESKYFIDTSDLILLREDMILSSQKKSMINDTLDNFYKLDDFEYAINQEILKGNKIELITNFGKPDSDKHFYENGFFNFKNQKFLVKDVKIDFDNMKYGNKENRPRLRGVYGFGDQSNTYLNKGRFTTCKNNDKCPPWVINSEKITHDKIKKQIIYKNAWLNIYNVPVVYFPKFFHPDPTVKRQSGFLEPNLISSKTLGDSLYTPYFYVISDDKDLTIKPRFYEDKTKFILQNEFRQKTQKSITIADFSYTRGYQSLRVDDSKDSRTHLFTKTIMDLNFDNFIKSDLEINFQKTSNDSYLKLFELESPLLLGDNSVLESVIKLDLEEDKYNFTTSIERYESLGGSNSDRYQYILPSYNFSRLYNLEEFYGSLNLNSYGNNTLRQTNVVTTSVINDLDYTTYNYYFDNGIKNDFGMYVKNLNSVGKNDNNYKTSPQSELMSAYVINSSYPLIKKDSKNLNTFEPKISLRYSPHDMKKYSGTAARINMSNIYSINRLGMSDSFEEGQSLTLGFDYRKEKIKNGNLKEMDNFFNIKMATVIRDKEEKNIPFNSTIGKKSSNIFGEVNYKVSKYVSLNYEFSIDNDLSTFEYNSIDSKFTYKDFSTEISFLEERGSLGSTNIIENTTQYNFNESNSIQFSTRKNRRINLTEFYDLIYKYRNDCLVAGIEYKKKYYDDLDVKPKEELFFSLTIVPLGTFSPEAYER